MKAATEAEIQNAICEYLAYKGYFFWRQNTGGMYREGRYFKIPKYAKRGIPDIVMIHEGNFGGIEVKASKGKLSPDQEAFMNGCAENGGRYMMVRSIDEVQAAGL